MRRKFGSILQKRHRFQELPAVLDVYVLKLFYILNCVCLIVCLFEWTPSLNEGKWVSLQGFSLTSGAGIGNTPYQVKHASSILTTHNSCNLIPLMRGTWQPGMG